ncbi:endo-beta-N-acetylglucosaminidase [Clostridium sardiniense]|uniref:endo-beta-N-acetylglucosaminidase n=1 Tax=Clostridium sardiniense TaxID=29369 RepID=UPI003D340FDD
MSIKPNKNKTRGFKRSFASKRPLACALALAITASMAPSLDAVAKETTNYVKGMYQKSTQEKAGNTLQPTGNGYSIKTLLEWSPESDENARYNRGSIKLQDRFTGPVVNKNANKDAKIMNCALTNPQSDNAPSQGGDTENAYAFSYWQYVDSYVYWGGTSKGIFLVPTADVIDSGHKNGVPVLGTVGFPWGPGEGHVEQIREFLAKDKDGKFKVADKMIEMARFYGFDGWFINQESYGCSKEDADLMVEFFTYMKETAPDIRIGWYDSMTTEGPVKYQDSLNPLNVGFFQNEGKRVTDEFFLNYNWDMPSTSFPEKSKVDMSVDTAKSVGRSQYDVYAGVEVQQNAYNDKFPVEHLLDENGKLKTSLAMYCPNSTFSMAKDVDDFYKHDQKFWVGPTGDPANTDTSEKWVGLSNYVADKSAINSLPFVTNFNLGHGKDYYIDGKLSRDKEWNNRAIQDYLPTWRWMVESNGSKLKPDFDRNDAYNGGSSLKIEGNLESKNPNHIKLYSTNLNIVDSSTELSLVYKTPLKENNMKIGLCFGDSYDDENFVFFDVKDGQAGQWNTAKISLANYVGKRVSAISLKFDSSEDINNYKINVGNISIEEKNNDKILEATSKITLDKSLLHNSKKAEAKIYWNDVKGAEFYEIYRIKPNGEREYVGSTYNDSYYIAPFNRYDNEKSFNFEVVAVDKNYNRGKAKQLKFNWNIGENDTEVPNEEIPVNVALNKKVRASSENAGEPAYKAVDGTVDNNSKWCTTTDMFGGWLEVDLGEEKTIKRWVTMHGEAGGEDKLTNTKDFRLQVSNDGRKTYKDVDTVVDNTEGIVDRNLKEPVTGRYFRIMIDHPGLSPWKAIRLYEFQLFEEAHSPKTENIFLNSVRAFNNVGAKDRFVAKNVPVGQEVSLYKNINDTKPFASKISAEDGIVIFDDLDFGSKEGRVFFTTKAEGKDTSIKLSTAYENENWEVTPIPDKFKIYEYQVAPRSLDNKYYGTIEAGDLKPGDILSYYENEDDIFPTKVSVSAELDTTILEGIKLNNDGGDLILEVSRKGMKTTPKFKLAYTSDKKASTKGEVEIKVEDSKGNSVIKDAVYEVLKDNKVVGKITTNDDGVGTTKLDPGTYTIKYTGNLKGYEKDDNKYEIKIEKAFDKEVKKLSLNKIKEDTENKPDQGEDKPEQGDDNSKPNGDKDENQGNNQDEKPNKNPDKDQANETLPSTGFTIPLKIFTMSGLLTLVGLILLKKRR